MDVLKNGELYLYGTVGAGVVQGEDGFTALDVRDALAKLGDQDATVRVNSGGGWSHEGVAIYNQLKAHRGKVTVIVEGVAASAASVLAMADQEIIMRPGAYLMVHEASGFTVGDTKDHAKTMEALETVNKSMADIYVKQTRRPNAEIRKEMAAETWMPATESVAKRYATRVADGSSAAKASAHAAFAWGNYRRAPTQIAAMAGTATLSAGFKAAMARAERAKAEEAIESLIRANYHRCKNDPSVRESVEHLRKSFPEAIERALSRPANVVDGPWRDVVDEVNQRNGFFALHSAVGK
ncbi:Clp protease ClpP [Ensifer sp. NBAIM29]|nr:Clp protease ClpP [Ensifer sp. NBAIM29]